MGDVPTIEEELERKVSETLGEALRQLQTGETSREGARASLDALWGATAGLVSKEMMEIIADAKDAVDMEEVVPRRRLFQRGASFIVLDLPEQSRMTVSAFMTLASGKTITRRFGEEDDTLRELKGKAVKAANSFLENGYTEIAQ